MNRIWPYAGIITLFGLLLALYTLPNGAIISAIVTCVMAATLDIDPCRDDSCIRTKSHVRRIRQFSEALSKVGPHSQYDEVARLVVDATSAAMSTDNIALFTIDSFSGSIRCECTGGVDEKIKDSFLQLYGNTLSEREEHDAWALQCIPDQHSECNDAVQTLVDSGICYVVAAPIRSETSASGALVAFYTVGSCYESELSSVIEAIAAQVSSIISFILALEQSRFLLDDLAGVNQKLSVQATVDGLTGLANHRTMQQKLNELCHSNSRNEKQVFSLVMLDVDHFKFYNDTHGHQEGDGVLRRVAKVLSSNLRQGDLAARYGGEEFALILRGISKDNASGVADRVRRNIADQPYRKGSVTVSMGIAQYPDDGSDPGEVIEKADKALYHAKIMGRNRVVVWGRQDQRYDQCDTKSTKQDLKSVLVLENPKESRAVAALGSVLAGSYRVRTSASLAETEGLLRTEVFDIALVSQESLPNCDVKQLARITAIHPDMPVILVAENVPMYLSKDAMRSGASDTLEKPCNPSELPLVIERNLERKRLEKQRMMQKSTGLLLQAIEALVAAIDAKDHHNAGHSKRVSSLSLAIAENLNISDEDRYALELAARLHDVGKLILPDSALNKESQLTEEEWQAMREHPILGSTIVGNIDELTYVGTIIRHHHERLDGSGYPDGLQGQAIPYLACIIAVADAYEAMTSQRAHRAPLTPYQAVEELWRQAGTHYCSELVQILEQHLTETGEMPPISHPHREIA